MAIEYQDSPEQKNSATGPKKGQENEKRSTVRVTRQRNALYTLVTEYKRRHPKATAADAWRNLVAIADLGVHDVLIAHDPDAGTLTYRPDPGRFETREIRKATFYRGFQRMADS
jgi:hypothetical protein